MLTQVPHILEPVPGRNGASAAAAPLRRIALYSHDAMGMGHLRRNALIAQTLASSPLRSGLLCISGTCDATTLALPPGADYVTLPALRKEQSGRRYTSRRLPLPTRDLIELRARLIVAALDAFEPDLFIVDKVPRGLLGELEPTLRHLRSRGRTRCVLGLRDVLDEPAVVQREWAEQRNEDAIRRYFDAVWVYGDPAVYDMAREYNLSSGLAGMIRYTGYLDQRPRLAQAEAEEAPAGLDQDGGRLALCLVGGGEDGSALAEAFAAAELPEHTSGVVVAGPMMPREGRERLHGSAVLRARMQVLDFVPEPGFLLHRAHRVVAMGGYNTTCEVLSHGKRALIVPRVHPRREQMIRAQRLHQLGVVDLLDPSDLSPEALARWLAADEPPAVDARLRIDFQGLQRIPRLVTELLASSPARGSRANHTHDSPLQGGAFSWRTPNGRASDMS
jgi:predicted glycosyltransferase